MPIQKKIHEVELPVNLKPEMTSILKLKHHPANVRVHDEVNLKAIMASLKRFGFQYPIVVDKHFQVIAGNGRLEASKRLGLKAIPVVTTQLDGEEAEAYAIADNRTSDLSQFDYEKLGSVIQRLKDSSVDVTGLGFEEYEMTPLLTADWKPPEIPEAEKLSPAQRMKNALEEIKNKIEAIPADKRTPFQKTTLGVVLSGLGIKQE